MNRNKDKAEYVFDYLHQPNLSYIENINNQIKCCELILQDVATSTCIIRTKYWKDIINGLKNLNND